MQISTKEIEKKIYKEFHLKYKAFSDFPDAGELWDLCIEAVRDPDLLNNIIFCNDVHEIPPVVTFVKVKLKDKDFMDMEKRSIGAFWGYVFAFVFQYKAKRSISAGIKNLRTATFFFMPEEKIKVV